MVTRWKKAAQVQLMVENLSIRDETVTGRHGVIPIRRYTPGAAVSGKLVWLHGGAFSSGGLDQLESHAAAAAIAQSGLEVLTVDYRRVPPWNPMRDAPRPLPAGIRFPVPLDDVDHVFEAIAGEPGTVFLGGASAGACLAAATALRRRDEGKAQPRGLVLAYGTFHAVLPPLGPGIAQRVRGRHGVFQFRPATVHRMNLNYAGTEEAMHHPHAFPGGHNPHGLPRTLLLDADRDALRASGEAFAAELVTAGVQATHRVVPNSTHGFLDRPHTPAFSAGISSICSWLTA